MDEDELAELSELAERTAPTLVGRTPAQAEAQLAATDARLVLRTLDHGAVATMEYYFGRITATVADGVIVQASPG